MQFIDLNNPRDLEQVTHEKQLKTHNFYPGVLPIFDLITIYYRSNDK